MSIGTIKIKEKQYMLNFRYEGDNWGSNTDMEDTPEFIIEAYNIGIAGIVDAIANLRGLFNKEGRIEDEAAYLAIHKEVRDTIANPPIMVEKEPYKKQIYKTI